MARMLLRKAKVGGAVRIELVATEGVWGSGRLCSCAGSPAGVRAPKDGAAAGGGRARSKRSALLKDGAAAGGGWVRSVS